MPSLNKVPSSERRYRGRRGQTIVLAIGILFLLTVLAGIFIAALVRNLQRVSRQDKTQEALQLAISGVRYAAEKFRTSEKGSDWRPEPAELLWRTPAPPTGAPFPIPFPSADPRFDVNTDGQLDGGEVRRIDPDNTWLSDGGAYAQPYARYSAGRGRFLLRVSYVPSYKFSRAASTAPDEFDEASGMIHIESIGRPGEFDPNDPTMFLQDPSIVEANAGTNGVYKKVEAWVPVGLVDQLWWITNTTNEQGAAEFGVPSFVDASNTAVTFPQVFEGGGFRSNRSVEFKGDSVFRLYPARGEAVQVAGRFGSGSPFTVRVQALDDDGQFIADGVIPPDSGDNNPANDGPIFTLNASGADAFDPFAPDSDNVGGAYPPGYNIVVTQDRVEKRLVRDERQRRVDADDPARTAIRRLPPNLEQLDPVTNQNRWLLLTRDSGRDVVIPDPPGSGTRRINTGWYGWTGAETLAFGTATAATYAQVKQLRALGLYLDNFGDIQYPGDRAFVKNEWLQRGSSDAARNGWLGDYYIPSVREEGINHPLAELEFITKSVSQDGGANVVKPFIRITRFDLDQRQLNIYPATDRQRQHHRWVDTNNDGTLDTAVPVGFTQDYDYPANGVVYCEGSIRVRGVVGTTDGAVPPQSLTVVSGGSIYLEGNLLTVPGWNIGLLAQDYVTLNPTAFTRVRPGNDVVIEADSFDQKGKPNGWHFNIPQGGDLDFSINSAGAIQNVLAFVQHTGMADDTTSTTQVSLATPAMIGTPGAQLDFNTTVPPNTPGFGPSGNPYYEFRQVPAVENPVPWAVSNYQTANGSPANWERKTFFIPTPFSAGPSYDQTFRLTVGQNLAVNAQPYWLSRVAIMPHFNDGSPKGYRTEPLQIRIEAVIYAYTGSWFIIPPPFFNRDPADTRQNFAATNLRAPGVVIQGDGNPASLSVIDEDAVLYPFYNEPLNYDIEIVGAINENKPAEPAEQAEWTRHLWRSPLAAPYVSTTYDAAAFPRQTRHEYSPTIRYRYNQNLKRMVRARIIRQGEAGTVIAWTGNDPLDPNKPGNVPLLSAVIAAGLAANSYVETLPLLPKLPASNLVYEGNALQ